MKTFLILLALSQMLLQSPENNLEYVTYEEITEEVSTMAVGTRWIYRTYNGKKQRRLWAIESATWLTDWIDC